MTGFKPKGLIEKLRQIFEEEHKVEVAVLFGSFVRQEEVGLSDVDIAFEGPVVEAELLMRLSEFLNIPTERIDLLPLGRLPTKVLARALSEGIILTCKRPDLFNAIASKAAIEHPEVMELYRLNRDYLLDPKGAIDEIRVLDLLFNIAQRARTLKALVEARRPEEFDGDPILDSALRWLVYEVVQSMIDVCAHVATSLRLAIAESYRDYVVTLVKAGEMQRELGLVLEDYAMLRNRLAHRYGFVGTKELVERSRKLVDVLVRDFESWAREMIKKHGR